MRILENFFWPANLAIFYPYRQFQTWEYVTAGLLLAAVSFICLRRIRPRRPYLLTGWLWFLITLIPVIGLMQVSIQSMADRYTYLPAIGVFIAVAWSMADMATRSRFWRFGMALGGAVSILACLLDTRHQLVFWKDSVTLFRHAVEVTGEKNLVGRMYLANALFESGQMEEAATNYWSVVQKSPDFEDAHYRLGYIRLQQKNFTEAETEFSEVVRINPENYFAEKFLGDALTAQEKNAAAQTAYQAAQQLKPDDTVIQTALTEVNQKIAVADALADSYDRLKTNPTPEVHARIAMLKSLQGKFSEAIEHYQAALQLNADSARCPQ